MQERDKDITPYATIPLDENGNAHAAPSQRNCIPDGQGRWDRDRNGHNGDHDLDYYPRRQEQDGDGLSRYEEWRGFLVGNEHERTDIRRKDLFVHDPDDLVSDSYFEGASRLTVHYVTAAQIRGIANREINFNRHTFSNVLQHALYVHDSGFDVNWSWGVSNGPNGPPGTKNADCIEVFVDQIEADLTRHMNATGGNPVSRNGRALVDRTVRYIATHETGHGVDVGHHGVIGGGRTECVMRYIFDQIWGCWSETGGAPADEPPRSPYLRNVRPWPTRFCTRTDNCWGQIDVSDPN